MVRFGVCLVVLSLATQLGADLKCSDLEIYQSRSDLNCISCEQWADGYVTKQGTDEGYLCLFLDGTETFNVCDSLLLLWIGPDWNENCLYVPSYENKVWWDFSSNREDWDDPRGAYAKIFIYVPCFSPDAHYVTPVWPETCDYCSPCD